MYQVNREVGSKYRFVILCAQRSRQLLEGADPRVESGVTKPAALAMQEVEGGKVKWQKRDAHPPQIPETSETIELEA